MFVRAVSARPATQTKIAQDSYRGTPQCFREMPFKHNWLEPDFLMRNWIAQAWGELRQICLSLWQSCLLLACWVYSYMHCLQCILSPKTGSILCSRCFAVLCVGLASVLNAGWQRYITRAPSTIMSQHTSSGDTSWYHFRATNHAFKLVAGSDPTGVLSQAPALKCGTVRRLMLASLRCESELLCNWLSCRLSKGQGWVSPSSWWFNLRANTPLIKGKAPQTDAHAT